MGRSMDLRLRAFVILDRTHALTDFTRAAPPKAVENRASVGGTAHTPSAILVTVAIIVNALACKWHGVDRSGPCFLRFASFFACSRLNIEFFGVCGLALCI